MQFQLRSAARWWPGLDRRSGRAGAETIRVDREVRAQASQHSAVSVASLEDFYDAHAARAYSLALRVLQGDRGAAEEIVVETLVAVWQSDIRSSEAKTPDLEIMLLRRIRQRCIDKVRGLQEAVRADEGESLPNGSPVGTACDGVAVTHETVGSALDTLSQTQRLCIEQAFFQGHTSAQIAEALGTSKGLVHQAMRRGLRALAERNSSTRTEVATAPSTAEKRAAR